jgi:hypothetical protein
MIATGRLLPVFRETRRVSGSSYRSEPHTEAFMKKLTAAALSLLLVGTATADIPPPIPKGFKRVPLSHRITTEAEFPDYLLFTVQNVRQIRETSRTAAPAKLNAKTPLTLSTGAGASVSTSYELTAVPKDAAKSYPTEKEFLKAVAEGKVAGQLTSKTLIEGSSATNIKDNDPRKEVVREYKLVKIDPKDGVVITTSEAIKKNSEGQCDEEDVALDSPVTEPARGGVWVAGFAASAALVFGGLWLARRGRRDVG